MHALGNRQECMSSGNRLLNESGIMGRIFIFAEFGFVAVTKRCFV